MVSSEGTAIAIASINPATGRTLGTFEPLADFQIEGKLARAAATFRQYRLTTCADRARMMLAAAERVESVSPSLAGKWNFSEDYEP